jgi:hypothetical protein
MKRKRKWRAIRDGTLAVCLPVLLGLVVLGSSAPPLHAATDDANIYEVEVAEGGAAPALVVGGGGFACGPDLTCDPVTQYCLVSIGGPAGVPPGYRCVDVRDVAPRVTCDKIPGIGIGCKCTESGSSVKVTCTAP